MNLTYLLYGGPANLHFTYLVTVEDQYGNTVSGVSVRMNGYYFVWELDPELQIYRWEGRMEHYQAPTDQNGFVQLTASADISDYYPDDYYADGMSLHMVDEDYTVISSQNTSSPYTNDAGSFVIIDDVDNNGIRDQWEMPLAEKFCPTLVMNHASEYCYPEPVEYYGVEKEDLWIYVTDITGATFDYPNSGQSNFNPDISAWHSWVTSPNNYAFLEFNPPYDYVGYPPGKSYGHYYLRFHYNFAGSLNDPAGWHNYYQDERQNNNYPHTTYVHLFLKDGYVVLQYWFFYPFNDYTNNHEGDWEHINVLVNSQDPQIAEIQRVDYYFHERVRIIYPNDPNSLLQMDYDQHPMVYIGGTRDGALGEGHISGGSYPKKGIWLNINSGNPAEIVAGEGPWVRYYGYGGPSRFQNLVILPDVEDIDFVQHPEMSWFKVEIPWGILGATSPGDWLPSNFNVGNDAPCGPAYNDAWNEIGTTNVYSLYTLNPDPLPGGSEPPVE